MLSEHDRVVLQKDLPGEGLERGDVGTVIHVHGVGEAFEVEFITLNGETIAVATLRSADVREVTGSDVTHVRVLANT